MGKPAHVPAILQEPRRHRYLKLIALFKISKGGLQVANSVSPVSQFIRNACVGGESSLSRSFSTARQYLAAKERNSAQRGANLTWPRHLACATVRKALKTHAKNPS